MILLALYSLVALQDTNTAISPRVRAMLDRFPPPRGAEPTVTVAFSRDTVWVGEQVELVTATWFPRQLRDRLRRLPTIRGPSLNGLWSARSQQLPVQAATRAVNGRLYDLYVTYQTIFPLGPGRIVAPPAVLNFSVPTSTSYFAPEVRKTYVSQPATLLVRSLSSLTAASIGSGPTARGLHVAWRGPPGGLRAGSPTIVDLVISGTGNVTLWPAPQLRWPASVHLYPEPTEEKIIPQQGIVAGEKHFRFTLVADSAGVVTLPAVNYPYFDPGDVAVHVATAAPFTLPVLPRPLGESQQQVLALAAGGGVPLATRIVRSVWPLLLLLFLAMPWLGLRRGRVRYPERPIPGEPEAALRTLLGTPADAGPDRVVAALRARGVTRDDAMHISRWLEAVSRRRYGPTPGTPPDPPARVSAILARLRHGTVAALLMVGFVLHLAAQSEADTRYHAGDYDGAARAYRAVALAHPSDEHAWRNLGAAEHMRGNQVGAAAAWLQALRLDPRDAAVRNNWRDLTAVPADVRALAPALPVSRDEAICIALVLWCAGWITYRRWRRPAIALLLIAVLVGSLAASRTWSATRRWGLVTGAASLRISPHPATMALDELSPWTRVAVQRRAGEWLLVTESSDNTGTVAATTRSGWIPSAAVAVIGPLD